MFTQVNPKTPPPFLLRRHVVDRVMAVAVAILVLSFMTWAPLGQAFVYRLDDQISRWLGFRSSSDIVVITLDDRAIEQLGGWPISRSHYTRLLERLAEPAHRPRAVGMDILFLDPRPEDAELARAMALLPVVLPMHQAIPFQKAEAQAYGVDLGGGWQRPVPLLANATRQGHIHVDLDSDGVVRGIQPMVNSVPHMAISMTAAAGLKLSRSPTDQAEIRVHMVDPTIGFPSISLSDALEPSFPLEIVKDKWVLVGSTSQSLGDMHVTQYTGHTGAPTPGVFILASGLNDVLHEDWIGITAPSSVYAFSAWLLTVLVLMTSQWRPATMLRIQISIIVLVTGVKVLLLVNIYWWINTAPFCLALPFGWLYWVTRKLEHTFRFMKRQVQNLPPKPQTANFSGPKVNRTRVEHWFRILKDPIYAVSSELQARTTQMSESLRLLDAIILQLPDSLAVFDAQGQLIISNPSMRLYLAHQNLKEPRNEQSLTLPVLRKTLGFESHRTIPPGSPIQVRTTLGTFYYLCTENRIEDDPEVPLHLLQMHDITQLREQENQRKKTLEFLSHDMRTPVAAIAAVAERLVRNPLQDAQISNSARDIVQYTARLMEMMDGFIDYSQATLADLKTHLHLVSNLLDDALSQVQILAEQQNTRFVVQETEYPLAIECDAHLVVRSLVNTLVNALHHGQAGGEVLVRTELITLEPQSMAVIEIRNQVGEAPIHPLVRGFGLGLEFVRMVMERHGGHMKASWWAPEQLTSPASQGTATLRLEIPNIHLDTDL